TAERAPRARAVGVGRTGRIRRIAPERRRTGLATTGFGGTRLAAARFLIRRRTRRTARRRRLRARRRPSARRAGPAARARGLRVVRSARDPAVLALALFSEPFFCARRARFQALRATAASLRARLASRLASFRRLRARLSSSLAIRTRCLA